MLSNGRVVFGFGVGWCEPEMRSVGVSFPDRGLIADDYLAAMRAVWTQAKPAYRGPFVSFEGVQAMPRPIQRQSRSSSAAAPPRPSAAR